MKDSLIMSYHAFLLKGLASNVMSSLQDSKIIEIWNMNTLEYN